MEGKGAQSKTGKPGSDAGDDAGLSVLREIGHVGSGLSTSTSPSGQGRQPEMVPHVLARAVTMYTQQESSGKTVDAREESQAKTTPPGARPRSYLTIDHWNQSHHAYCGRGVIGNYLLTILRMQQAAEKHHTSYTASCHADYSYSTGSN